MLHSLYTEQPGCHKFECRSQKPLETLSDFGGTGGGPTGHVTWNSLSRWSRAEFSRGHPAYRTRRLCSLFFQSLLYFCARPARRSAPQKPSGPIRFLCRCGRAVVCFQPTSSFSRNSGLGPPRLRTRSAIISLAPGPFVP